LRHINDGLIEAAADAILMWNKPPEIIGRRRAEAEQFLDLQHVARV
jgi:GH24 family phage-related lysozyme (muramidase)